jgi:asparagine synthase (glutamine-hydrolysing)
MCGIVGVFSYASAAPSIDRGELDRSRDAMMTRGPDGGRTWVSDDARVGLGHRRLAIIDINDRASQPMRTPDERLTIVFNGEIYNYVELRDEIAATGQYSFRTHSDTEVLLALYLLHGAEMVHHLRGMFAFAIHDARDNSIFLARDPYGIKPLYIADDGRTLRFASTVKALLAGGKISKETDPAGLVGFHIFGAVQEPFTLYRSISALPSGHVMRVDRGGAGTPRCYANIAARLAAAIPDDGAPVDDVVREAVLDSVRAHLVADVEVGTFLSSGVDSGALLGLMRDAGAARVSAVTIGFEELTGTADDEVPLAREVAKHYGASHHVSVIGRDEFAGALPLILEAMDQPSIDGINSWLVSRAAHECGLKVVLSGLGGDELLAGYTSFQKLPQLRRRGAMFRKAVPLPSPLVRTIIKTLAPGLARDNPKVLGVHDYATGWGGAYMLSRAVLLPFELDRVLDAETIREGMARLDPVSRIDASLSPMPSGDIRRVMALESSNYMRNQLLRDSDWASMAHSLELRTPLVDWRLLEKIAPIAHRLGGRVGKKALAMAPQRPLPTAVFDRKRTGFTVPIGQWLRPSAAGPASTDSRAWSTEIAQAFAS